MDGIKLALMEDIVPRGVDKLLFVIAPAISVIPAFISFAIIPWGPIVSIGGHRTPLQLTDLPVAVLLVLAMSSLGVYGIVLAGWSAQSPVLPARRAPVVGAGDQLRDRDGPVVRAGLPVRGLAVHLADRRRRRPTAPKFHFFGVIWHWPSWFAILLLPSFVIYIITMVGETNRLPFDLPEGEGELVGGYHTEYSSLKFALIQLAEYVSVITVSALATTLFLGGWRAPWPISVWSGANTGWWPVLWFLGKVVVFVFCFFWLRASLPRIRYDQLMKLGWKVLIPVALGLDAVVATARVYRRQGGSTGVYLVAGAIVVVLLLLWRGSRLASGGTRSGAGRRTRKRADDSRPAASAPRSRPRPWTCRIITASGLAQRGPASAGRG